LPVIYEASNLLTDIEAGKEHNRNLIVLMSVKWQNNELPYKQNDLDRRLFYHQKLYHIKTK